MSTKAPKQAPTVRSDVEAFFRHVEASGFQSRLRTVTGTCQFNLEGAGTWWATVNEGVVTVTEGAAPTPAADFVVSCTAEDFLRIVYRKNRMNVMAAVLQEIMTIKGDIAFAYAVLGGIVLTPDDASLQQGIRSE